MPSYFCDASGTIGVIDRGGKYNHCQYRPIKIFEHQEVLPGLLITLKWPPTNIYLLSATEFYRPECAWQTRIERKSNLFEEMHRRQKYQC